MYHEKFPGFSLVTVKKRSFVDDDIVLGILYRKNTSPLNLLSYYDLAVLVNNNNINILLGDFNINYFEKEDVLSEVLSDFKMIVTTPTYIDGSLLDHIYVKYQFLAEYDVVSIVKGISFSDHDVVKIKIIRKL